MCCFNGKVVTLKSQLAVREFGLCWQSGKVLLSGAFRSQYIYWPLAGKKSFVTYGVPSHSNKSGFYAYSTLRGLKDNYRPTIYAYVRLSGEAVAAAKYQTPGWRARRMTLVRIVVLTSGLKASYYRTSAGEVAKQLRLHYHVPVRITRRHVT